MIDNFLEQLLVERLNETHNTATFNCGVSTLNSFLQRDALDHQRQRISFSAIYLHDRTIAGYLTLATDSLQVELDEEIDDIDTRFRQFPALKVCRIARDLRFKGMGLGPHMLEDALGFAFSLNKSDQVIGAGCRFVTVDIRDPSLIMNFYVPFGFVPHTSSEGVEHFRYDLGVHSEPQIKRKVVGGP